MEKFIGSIVLAIVLFAVGGIIHRIGEAFTGRNAKTTGSFRGGRIDIEHKNATSGSSSLVGRGIGHLLRLVGMGFSVMGLLVVAYALLSFSN